MKSFITIIFSLTYLLSFSQGETCATAVNLGALNNPPACPGGGASDPTVYNGTTIGAVVENPFTALSCVDSPALDSWVSFVAAGNELDINLTSGFNDANISLYSGGSCATMGGYMCEASNNGNASILDVPIVAGQQYYIQISGIDQFDEANFTLTLTATNNCSNCLMEGSIVATPAPVGGFYLPNTLVQFCFTVESYNQISANWLSGVVPTFSSNWDLTTLTGVSVPNGGSSSQGNMDWYWVPGGISAANPNPGFYVDADPTGGGFNPDGNFTNNWGDPAINLTTSGEFCFQIATNSVCVPGGDLGISINTLSDYETGGYGSSGCVDDPEIPFSAVMQCCDIPLISSTIPTCLGDADGQATAQGQGGLSPYTYDWVFAGASVFNETTGGVSTATGLVSGVYTVTVTDATGCEQIIDITVGPGPLCPTCYFDFMSTSTGACETGSVFTESGEFSFDINPGGNITVSITNNSGTYTQTITGPFVDGTLYPYSISGIPADGSAGTVTITFDNDLACTISQGFTSPVSCECNADIGTFNIVTTAPVTGTNATLCFGDLIDINSVNDWTAPDEAFAPPGPAYDPTVSWMVYTCPPTLGLVPTAGVNIFDDPCNLGIVSDVNLNELNDMWWINAYPPGTFTDNIVYFVPITVYSNSGNTYTYTNTTVPCYEIGSTYGLQYIPEITEISVEDCTAGTVTTTVTGGLPAINGSSFTGQNLLPATASFTTGTATNGNDIVVGGLVDGDAYSFDIVDANGCPITITGTFVGLEDPAFTYPASAYCQSAANPSPTITGVTGGTFTAPAGVSINPSTGVINLAASTAGGPYTITYTTPDPICFDQATFNITINPNPIVDGNDVTVCAGQSVTLNGTGANTYIWSGGVTNNVAFVPGGTLTYNVTGTVTATGCTGMGNALVTVNALDNPSFTTTNYCQGTASPAATITGTTGGTFAFNPLPGDGATINAASGSITGGVGGTTYTVEYTTAGLCPQSSTQPVTVYALPTVVVPDYSVCTGGTVALTASGANTYSWSLGTYLDATTGTTVNSTPLADITYTILGTDGNGCVNSDLSIVTVIPNAPIDAGMAVTICAGETTTLTATGGVTYNWLAPISAAGAVQNVTPATTTTYTVNGVDAAGCSGSDQVIVTVNPLPTATISGTTALCVGAAAPTITFNGANGTAPYTFTYNINGGGNLTVVSNGAGVATVTAPTGTAGTFNYNLVSVQDASTTSCSQTQVGIATVTVNALPNVFAGNDYVVCENNQAILTGSGALLYSWTNGVTNGVSFNPTATNTYTVTGTDANGCVNTDDVTVTVEALPAVFFTADVTSGCAPLTVTFTNNTPGAMSNCVWSFSNGTTLNGCGSVSTTFTNGGLYDATLTTTSANGCSNSITFADYIYVEDLPIAAFTASSNVVSVYNPEVQFDNNSTGAVNYSWDFGDNSSSTSVESPTHTFPDEEQGNYVVELIAYSSLGCTDTAYLVITVNEEIIFYVPNTFTPDNDVYNEYFQPVFTAGYDPFDFTLLIFNRWGELIFESHDASKGWDGTYGTDGREVEDGTYTWKIEFKTNRNDERKMVIGHVNILR